MKFTYKARTKDGKASSGVIEANSKEAAAALLQKYNIFVTSLEAEKEKGLFSRRINIGKKASKKDLTIFFRQLSVMLEARVPIVQSLSSLASQTKKAAFKEIIVKVGALVEEGSPLSGALASEPSVFGNFYVNLIKSGEASGSISSSLNYIADHLEREDEIISQLRQATVYPIFVVSILLVVMGIIILQVMPRITELIKESSANPPLFTRIMLSVYQFLASYWWAILLGIVLFIFFAIYYFNTKGGRDNINTWALKTPFIGSLLKKVFLTRFCGNISTLVSAGISINKALSITAETVNNVVYQRIIADIEKEISEGEKISVALSKYPDYFPSFVVQMIKVGEETGKLDKTLEEIVSFYQKEIKRALDLFSSLIEPIMIIFLGAIVAILAISVLSPLYGVLGTI